MTLEREPSCFDAAALEGNEHEFIVARAPHADDVVAFGSRSFYDGYVDGRRKRLGYVSQLRVTPGRADTYRLLRRGYTLLNEIDSTARRDPHTAPFYLTTIVHDNVRARRLLERGLHGLPVYRPLARFVTLVVPVRRGWLRHPRGPRWTGRIERGATAFARHRSGISACLQHNAARLQFARHWSASELASEATPGLTAEDFCIAVRDGQVVGCLAHWDQRALKQVVIRGYARRLALVRPIYNALAPLRGTPALPPVGSALAQSFISHIAVDGDDPECFLDLFEAVRERAAERHIELLTLGFAHGHPLLRVTKRAFAHRAYESILYAVHWDDGAASVSALDGRAPHLEVATL